MSVKVMGLVWDSDLPRDQKFVLLAYADHAEHDGTNVFPSIPKIAWKTGYSERQIQRITNDLIAAGILAQMGESRYGTNLYRINIMALPGRDDFTFKKKGRPKNSDNMSPLSKNGDISANNGDILKENGDIVMSPDSSFNRQIKTSSLDTSEQKPEQSTPSNDGERISNSSSSSEKTDDSFSDLYWHFIEITKLPEPRTDTKAKIREAKRRWRGPLEEIFYLAGGDIDKARRLINAAVYKMRDDGLSINSPQSILKVATAKLGEWNSGHTHSLEGYTYGQ